MAKPIKETPVLTGKDAKDFMKNLQSSSTHKVDAATRAKIKTSFEKLSAIAQF
jgi:hypothetical protein